MRQVQRLLGGKRVHVAIDTREGSERVVPSWFESPLWGVSPGFPLAGHLAWPACLSVSGTSQPPATCVCISELRWSLAQRPVDSWHHLLWGDTHSPFDLQGIFLCLCHWGGLLNFDSKECVIFSLGTVQPPPSLCFYGVSVHRGETVQAWGPSVSCLSGHALGTCLGVWVGMRGRHHCGGEKTRDRFVRSMSSSSGHPSIQEASNNCRMRSWTVWRAGGRTETRGWLPGTGRDLGETGQQLELSPQARPLEKSSKPAAGRVRTTLGLLPGDAGLGKLRLREWDSKVRLTSGSMDSRSLTSNEYSQTLGSSWPGNNRAWIWLSLSTNVAMV